MARGSIAAPGGAGGIVLAGAPGVGKSRLAREVVEHARAAGRPCRRLYATASARSVPLGVFAEFAASFGTDPLLRVHEVITALTQDRLGLSTVVAVDDAHLLDEQSALVVHQLVHRRAATVVLTVRTGEPAPDAIASLYKDYRIPRVEVQPLSALDVAELAEQLLGGHVETASAQRLWRYTRGNVLYLHQLVDDEVARGTLFRRSGVWVWTGNPDVSPTLTELIESTVGRHDRAVVDVIDTVAIADPLELSVLRSLAPSAAISEAEAHGVVTVDADAGVVRLAHPLYGEARRTRMGTLQLAELGRRVSDAISVVDQTPQQLVRRAHLISSAAGPEDARLFTAAAESALYLMDLDLAVEFAARATECEDSVASQILYGFALVTAARAEEGERVLRDAAEAPEAAAPSPDRAQIGLFRAASLAWNLGRPAEAEIVLDAAQAAAENDDLAASFDALRASLAALRGEMGVAARAAAEVLTVPDLHPTAHMFCVMGLAVALGDLGDLKRLDAVTRGGYTYAEAHPRATHQRFGLTVMHIDGLRLAGELGQMRDHTSRWQQQVGDHPSSSVIGGLIDGMTGAAHGELKAARRRLSESLAAGEHVSWATEQSGYWLAAAHAMAGDASAARTALDEVPARLLVATALWDPLRHIAGAWTCAAEGELTSALATLAEAAALMRAAGRPAGEVWCLQTAAQFGDARTAARLGELATAVGGPRAAAAAAHAAALAGSDGAALLDVSRSYDSFGDRLAAADAAAQAATAFRVAGSRGSALTAMATATRLADQCGADTPALRAATTRAVLTSRQREIASLVAAGLSNREIADRLHMSVRSVEGHIFRASQRNGVTSRAALAALLDRRVASGQPR